MNRGESDSFVAHAASNKMSRALRDILQDKRVKQVSEQDTSTACNLVSMIAPKGSFYIGRDIKDVFLDEYCRYVAEDPDPMVGLAEKSDNFNPFIPVLVDVDIKMKEDDSIDMESTLYNEQQLSFVVRTYQQVLKEIVEGIEDKHLACFVLEKRPYKIQSGDQWYVKNGFHLHFPWIFLSKTDQECHLVPRVQKQVTDAKLFEELGFQDSGALIDKSYTRVPWLMYGSRKAENMAPYYLTTVFTASLDALNAENPDELASALHGYKLYDVRNQLIDIRGNETYYLPRILSIHVANRECFEIKSTVKIVRPRLKTKRDIRANGASSSRSRDNMSPAERFEDARKLIEMLSPARADMYDTWMTVIWCLFNTFDGDPAALDLAHKFSALSPKYKEDELDDRWSKMVARENGFTIRTLHHYAKLDNPEAYKAYSNEFVKKHVRDSLGGSMADGSHNDIAKALHKMYGNVYTCTKIVQDEWYEFYNHGWKRVEAGTTLRAKISDVLVKEIVQICKDIYSNEAESDSRDEKKSLEKQRLNVQRIVSNLKNAPFKNNVMKECREEFYDEMFNKQLNANKYIIRFKNGIYDLKTHIFRDGLPEDYCSFTLGVNYREFEETDHRVLAVHDFLNKVFPDTSIREYFLNIGSKVFVGGNAEKKIWFWTGSGDNGKSITESIFEQMMGEYATKLPTSTFTGKRTQSSGATPELARLAGKRWVTASEPGKKDVFNISVCKELSGNDDITVRRMYQENEEIKATWKVCIVCNDPPIVPDNDKAFWNRCRLIPFESTFCHDAPATWEEQLMLKRFPIDNAFADKIPDLIEAFAWVLLNHRKRNQNLPMVEPEKVKLATAAYRLRNDFYSQFVDECLVADDTKYLTVTYAYDLFKNWYRESLPGHVLPTRSDLKEQLDRKWGEASGKPAKWKGWRDRTDADNGDIAML